MMQEKDLDVVERIVAQKKEEVKSLGILDDIHFLIFDRISLGCYCSPLKYLLEYFNLSQDISEIKSIKERKERISNETFEALEVIFSDCIFLFCTNETHWEENGLHPDGGYQKPGKFYLFYNLQIVLALNLGDDDREDIKKFKIEQFKNGDWIEVFKAFSNKVRDFISSYKEEEKKNHEQEKLNEMIERFHLTNEEIMAYQNTVANMPIETTVLPKMPMSTTKKMGIFSIISWSIFSWLILFLLIFLGQYFFG